MVFSLLNRHQKTANLVFTDQTIRFIELGAGGKNENLKIAERKIGPGKIKDGKIIDFHALRIILEECVDEWKLKKRKVRFIMPDQHIVVRHIEVPLDVREDELKNYLFLELGSTIHLPFEEPIFDSVPLGNNGHKQQILLVAAPGAIIQSYIDLLEAVKLEPIAADISPLSLYRLYYNADQAVRDDHIMILNMDEQLMTISIFHNDVLIFMRPVSIVKEMSLEDVMEESASTVLSLFENTFKEIEKVLSFYQYSLNQGNASVNKVLICGDHTHMQQAKNHLTERLQMNVEVLISDICLEKPDAAAFSTVIGLALKEVVR